MFHIRVLREVPARRPRHSKAHKGATLASNTAISKTTYFHTFTKLHKVIVKKNHPQTNALFLGYVTYKPSIEWDRKIIINGEWV
jgi:hypothetical protein